ncbi:MAG: hypothetical protein A2Z04_09980 [Chloroflexi bacterium RBG_16_57_9]|nr:MAG: hypothetical protein A2Z04_09980 [Chloroflexi bacterium RBG_16_57_9]
MSKQPYDIKERTFEFGVRIIKLVNAMPRTVAGIELGRQVVRSGTSVGANVEEADGATTRKEFAYKVGISRKEARETRFWLRLIQATGLLESPDIPVLIDESDQLVRILSTIIKNAEREIREERTMYEMTND